MSVFSIKGSPNSKMKANLSILHSMKHIKTVIDFGNIAICTPVIKTQKEFVDNTREEREILKWKGEIKWIYLFNNIA